MKRDTFNRWLFCSSIFYLLLPNLLFFAAWFSIHWAIVLGLFSLAVYVSICRSKQPSAKLEMPNSKQFILIAFSAIVICLFSGIGGFHFQGDYIKHYTMLHDLVYKEWPVVYEQINGLDGEQHLNYYFGYFLPPAALAKITSLELVDNWIIVWSFIGLGLAFLWFVVLTKTKHVFWPLCFLLFLGGQDYLYALIKLNISGFWGDATIAQNIFEQEVSAVCVFHNTILRYPTNFFAISWAPQHIIGTWVCTAILYYIYKEKFGERYILFIVCLMPLWSIFSVIGFFPIIAGILYKSKYRKLWMSWENGLSILIGVCILSFFIAHHSIADKGFLWEYIDWPKLLFKWPVFLLFEVLYIAIALYYFAKGKVDKVLFFAIVLFSSIIPIYVLGNMNDLLIRAIIPSLFILNLMAFKTFQEVKSIYKPIVMILVFTGVVFPQAISITKHFPSFFMNGLRHGFNDTRVKVSSMNGLDKLAEEEWFNTQYFGDNNSFYFKYLAPKSDKK